MAELELSLSPEYPDVEAKRKLEQVDERLSCAICLGRFVDPRMLDCRHSFCRRCLEDVFKKRLWDPENPLEDDDLPCPKCRTVTKVKEGGVDALPVNFDLKGVVELFADQELVGVLSPFSPPSSNVFGVGVPYPVHMCVEHTKPLEFFCQNCDTLLCGNCLVKPIHRGHTCREAKHVIAEEHHHLRSTYLESADMTLLNMTVGVTEVKDTIRSLKERGEELKGHIQEQFEHIHQALREREQRLVRITDAIIAKKIVPLQDQLEVLKKSKQELETQVEYLNKILEKKDDFGYLKDKQDLLAEVKRVIHRAQSKYRKPIETVQEGPEGYLPNTLLEDAKRYGEVFCKPYPPKFIASGDGLRKAFLDREAKFVIHAHDRFGQRSFISGANVEVTIQGPDGLPTTSPSITEHAKGEYIVKYTPKMIGHHSLAITADDRPISNSTAVIVVLNNKDYLSMRMPINRITKHQVQSEVSTMRGVCVLPDDNIVFADAFCLRVITPAGQLIRTIGAYGNAPGQFTLPLGVAANRSHLFVSDSTNHRIEKFSSDGRFMLTFGTIGIKHGQFNYPEGISLLGEDKIYVADRGNHRIQVFQQKNGKYHATFGKKGDKAGQFDSPRDVAIDTKNSRVFVTDSGNFRVQALSLDGKPLQQFGDRESSVYMTFPYFITTDPDGFILVTETRPHTVSVLSPHGKLVKQLGTQGNAPGQFRTPYGICINSKGEVVITDSSNYCIQIF